MDNSEKSAFVGGVEKRAVGLSMKLIGSVNSIRLTIVVAAVNGGQENAGGFCGAEQSR
jgi:hypothetical protein